MMLAWIGSVGAWGGSPVVVPEAQLRPRWEADSGRDGVAGGEVSYATLRTRLGATFTLDDVSARIVFTDVRVLGSELDTRRDFDAEGIDLRIGILSWQPGAFTLEVGRFERGLHDQRLVAIANWRQAGRSFDGAAVAWDTPTWRLEGRAWLVREGDALDLSTTDQAAPAGRDKTLWVLSGGWDTDELRVLPTLIVDTDGDLDRIRATAGIWSRVHRGPLSLRGEAYVQGGREGDTALLAGMIGVEGAWSPEARGKPVLGIGYDLLSGGDDDGQTTAFDTLYGANHRYYGHIDIAMFQVGGFVDGRGLQDLRAFARIHPDPRLQLRFDLHAFSTATDGAFLALEPDVSARWTLAEPLSWTTGMNLWLPGDGSDWMLWSMLDLRL